MPKLIAALTRPRRVPLSFTNRATAGWTLLRRLPTLVVAVGLLLSVAACSSTAPAAQQPARSTDAAVVDATAVTRNIILFVSDGCGPASFTLTRQFLDVERGVRGMALDSILVGHVATRSADALITDSASSATAYACGIRTDNGLIGMASDRSPVRSVVEVAQMRGMSTGLVATSRITHATPASFSAHVPDRGMEEEIASQQIASGVDLLIGGGRRFFVPDADGGSRKDGRNLLDEARAAGYTVVESGQELQGVRLPVVGLLADDHLPYEIDRGEDMPSLTELTNLAIELLSTDEDGFFLLVEGSRIDHAAHSNDVAAHVNDIVAYDRAVSAALRFARRDGETLVVSVSDHETGGLTVGRAVDGRSMYVWHPDVVGRIGASHDVILPAVADDPAAARATIERLTGITDFADGEIESLLDAESRAARERVLAEMISRRTLVGWTTGGHTAVDVNLFAFGPGSDQLKGHVENYELGEQLIRLADKRPAARR